MKFLVGFVMVLMFAAQASGQEIILQGGMVGAPTLGYEKFALAGGGRVTWNTNRFIIRQEAVVDRANKLHTGEGWYAQERASFAALVGRCGPAVGISHHHLNGGPWTKDGVMWSAGVYCHVSHGDFAIMFEDSLVAGDFQTTLYSVKLPTTLYYRERLSLHARYGVVRYEAPDNKHWGASAELLLGWKIR